MAFIVAAYFLGAIPFSFIIGKLAGVDLRTRGSGNVGATNVYRVVGFLGAVIAFLLDGAKGFLAPWLAQQFAASEWVFLMAGLAVVIGHVFPIFLKFRGGKGVATSLGVLTALAPELALGALLVWVVVFGLSRIVSLASLVACWSALVTAEVVQLEKGRILLMLILVVLITARHRANIIRLARREESRIG